MKRKDYLFLFFVVMVAFWQVSFLQNGMKWDFVDAYLPSRYFFSESILNNQFPLWNPYLLYGTPIYADLTSVFSPEFWIIGNMFGYSNISLQYVFLLYVFVAGVSFFYFLKQFDAESNISLGLSVAYMLSGFTIGNAQHVAFVAGYALLPFVVACYIRFLLFLNKRNFLLLGIALFLMVYVSYPGLTIILAYFLLGLFVYYFAINWKDKTRSKNLLVYHLVLLLTVVLFSSVYLLAYFQALPFLSRYSGISAELALRHSFTLKSFLSFVMPMATGADPGFFETDVSMSNGYWGILSLVLFLFSLTKKVKHKDSYVLLLLGVLSLWASLGDQFFLRRFLFNHAPFMDMFKYPAIFRATAIFSFLAFIGINFRLNQISKTDSKRLFTITGIVGASILVLMGYAVFQLNEFVFFDPTKSFSQEILSADRLNAMVLQGSFQVFILLLFGFLIWKVKAFKLLSVALLLLFAIDGIVSTQFSINHTVISDTNPVRFYNYLKSSPKGFSIPELNPMGENSDKNAGNEFTWMNNNVFPKKVTFDGLVSFKLDGYANLADNYPDLLQKIKKEPLVYFSDDVRENTKVENFKSNTVFVSELDYSLLCSNELRYDTNDRLEITTFSPTAIEIKTSTKSAQLITCQQNYFTGWKVFIDGNEQVLIKSNFAHMSVLVPGGDHQVYFKYTNQRVIYAFGFSMFIFVLLLGFWIRYYTIQHPEKKKGVVQTIVFCLIVFTLATVVNRYLYIKNKKGLNSVIVKNAVDWKQKYNDDVSIFLSTRQQELKNKVDADTTCYVDENTNIAALSDFMIHSQTNYFAFAWLGSRSNNVLMELIYSFYPKIVEQKRDNNSGIVLLSKTGDSNNYVYCEDFEQTTVSGWPIDTDRLKVNSLDNTTTYLFNPNQEWGTTLNIPVDKSLLMLKQITVVTDLLPEEKSAIIPLVFSVDRNHKNIQYEASSINRFVKYPNQWARAVVVFDVKTDLQEGDIISIYFWNKEASRFQIDNIKLKLFFEKD
ncbi:hypothetical protein [uncultured Draconibacterium sp.]|uniref:hypothetical protein n=1 Tax=uncultured Draconibacterium sp. TaxID=1573823 RepID=UPI00321671B3